MKFLSFIIQKLFCVVCFQGTKDIEAISLDASNVHPNVNLSSFRSMYNLRYLKIFYSKPESENNRKKALESLSLPYGLKFLHWEHYPLQSLPQDFDPSNLVEIDMPHSQLQTLWGGTKVSKLKSKVRPFSAIPLAIYLQLCSPLFSEPQDAQEDKP